MAAGTASALHPRITPASADCRRPGRPPLMEIRAMRMDKLTSRFQQALADAQSLAVGSANNLIEPAPLLLALLDQSGGGTPPLIPQAAANVPVPRVTLAQGPEPPPTG